MEAEIQTRFDRLSAILAQWPSLLVAFSGGVDSSLLLAVARRTLGERAIGLTAVSPTMPQADRRSALDMAALIGARHLIVETNELDVSGYSANPVNRCYLCKSNLFDICEEKARELGIAAIADGLNLDDLRDYRPGVSAAGERQILHPLVEAGLDKAAIRELSHALGLPTWDRPASPCLSSRFPYGTPITVEALRMVEAGERRLHELGFRIARVRYHGEVARIEVDPAEIGRLMDPVLRSGVYQDFRRIGFRFVTVDLVGFRSGSLNEGLGLKPTPGS